MRKQLKDSMTREVLSWLWKIDSSNIIAFQFVTQIGCMNSSCVGFLIKNMCFQSLECQQQPVITDQIFTRPLPQKNPWPTDYLQYGKFTIHSLAESSELR